MARAALQTVVVLLLLAALLFGAAGRLDWAMGWAVLVAYAAICVAAFAAVDPALLAERGRPAASGKRSDLLLAGAFVVLLYPASFVVAGLDRRFGASPALPLALQVVALAVFVAGYGFALWAMRENAFFTTVVRAQDERGHRVIDTGPYGIVRHPGYAGSVVAHLALPLALGCLLVATRTLPEERALRRELAGYPE
jgi:protein-S-isoprenylcysteine O-methyltransferase Ste14